MVSPAWDLIGRVPDEMFDGMITDAINQVSPMTKAAMINSLVLLGQILAECSVGLTMNFLCGISSTSSIDVDLLDRAFATLSYLPVRLK